MPLTKVDSSARPGDQIPKDLNYSDSSSFAGPEDRYHDLEETAHESQHRNSVMNIRDILRRNAGLFLITMSQCCVSSMNAAVKKLNSLDLPVPTMELIAIRMGLTALFSLSYMIVAGVSDPFLGPKDIRSLLLLRGSAGFVGLSGLYFSLQNLSLSDATVLTFLAPICLAFTGAIFLGETFYLRQVVAGLVSLGGVVLIARPTFLFGPDSHIPHLWIYIDSADSAASADRLISVGVALIGVVGATTAYTTIRGIGKRAHAMHSMVYFSAVCVLGSLISMAVTRTPFVVPTDIEWILLLILIGILGFMTQLFLTMGLQRETVSRGSMAMYTQIIFATIFQRIFFHSYPTLYSALGIILISGSALYVVVSTSNSKEEIKKTGVIRLPNDDIEEGILGRQAVDVERAT